MAAFGFMRFQRRRRITRPRHRPADSISGMPMHPKRPSGPEQKSGLAPLPKSGTARPDSRDDDQAAFLSASEGTASGARLSRRNSSAMAAISEPEPMMMATT